MFGVGPQELIVIVLLVLVVFGPVKAAGVARDLGRFAGEARGQVEEFKGELVPEELKEARRSVKELDDEVHRAVGERQEEAHRRK